MLYRLFGYTVRGQKNKTVGENHDCFSAVEVLKCCLLQFWRRFVVQFFFLFFFSNISENAKLCTAAMKVTHPFAQEYVCDFHICSTFIYIMFCFYICIIVYSENISTMYCFFNIFFTEIFKSTEGFIIFRILHELFYA